MPDALPVATLPIYPGLGQAPIMCSCAVKKLLTHSLLGCIPVAWFNDIKAVSKYLTYLIMIIFIHRHHGREQQTIIEIII